jgi:hypothetical protein
MRKSLYFFLFVLAIAIAYASAQAQEQPQSGAAATQNPQTAPSGVRGQAASPAQGNPSATNVPGGATDASGGGVAGSAGTPTGKTEIPETPQPAPAVSDTELQSEMQNALSKEPTLAGDTVNVRVSSESIDLTGNVGTAREKLTATRIVESYAGNKKVVSHLTIGNPGRNAAPASYGPGGQANPPNRPDISSRPETEKGSRTGASTRPPG